MSLVVKALRYERTEYGKLIRKEYERGRERNADAICED